MWSSEDGFYYDLDKDEKQVKTKTVGFHENVPTDMVLITGASRFE